ncbi:MAG TPA: methyltransferase, FxLD system [Streptosporangiaceae bacterium]|nr:methyltransferase, FxLD system [Streptosporangiaceae bacterium]
MAVSRAPADLLRAAMVDRLRDRQLIGSDAVEAALRAVPRHLFVPRSPLEDAYGSDAIVTHRDAQGIAVSSASAPSAVAGMLEQLDVRRGHRVLEIGAGTGYNAALLARLAGPAGQVTTLDIDEDVVGGAQRGLAAAGFEDVSVICGDGEFGYPGHAPYDRIIITAGAWDLPPAWHEQLAARGRLVVPLRMKGMTRSVAFERQDGYWRSRSIEELGFVPMRGAGSVAERNLRLGSHADITLRVDDGQPADAEALGNALGHPPALAWTGVTFPAEGLGHLDFWLAGLEAYGRLIVHSRAAIDRGLVTPVYRWGSMAVFGRDTFAYLTERSGKHAGSGTDLPELGVCAYGPGGADLARRVADRIQAWDRIRRSIAQLWVEVHPAGTGDSHGALMVIDKRHTRVIVRTTPLLPVAHDEGS